MALFDNDPAWELWTLKLTDSELAVVMKPIAPIAGGHEDYLRELQPLFAGRAVTLSDSQLLKCYRYAYTAKGGHQDRFKMICAAAWRAGWKN